MPVGWKPRDVQPRGPSEVTLAGTPGAMPRPGVPTEVTDAGTPCTCAATEAASSASAITTTARNADFMAAS